MNSNMYVITESENMLDDLEMALWFMRSAIPLKYKWVSFALYQALYCAFVIGIQSFEGDPVIYIFDKVQVEIWFKFQNGLEINDLEKIYGKDKVKATSYKTRLVGFEHAFTKYFDQKNSVGCSSDQEAIEREKRAIRRLKTIRHSFEHFSPSVYALDFRSIHSIYLEAIGTIETIIFRERSTYLDIEDDQKLLSTIHELRELFSVPV